MDRLLARIALALIGLYQATISPDKGVLNFWLRGRICAHHPHCSEYGKECFQRYGFVKGLALSVDRVISCTPASQVTYDPSHYKVVFFSSAPIGVPFLRALAKDKRFDLVGVVTMPDAASGRGMHVQSNIIKTTAQEIGLSGDDIQTPPGLKTSSPTYAAQAQAFEQRLEAKKPDFLVVIAYGKIIPQNILSIPYFGPINVHGSLLPAYRGASPLQTVFLESELLTGITIMVMSPRVDEGPILDRAAIRLPFDRTVKDLIEKIQQAGPKFLLDTLRRYGKREIEPQPQDPAQVTYSKKIEKQDGLVDPFHDSLETIYPKRRAYVLRPKTYFDHQGKQVIIDHMSVDQFIYHTYKSQPLIDTDHQLNPAVFQLMVKPEGKKAITREDYLRGYVK